MRIENRWCCIKTMILLLWVVQALAACSLGSDLSRSISAEVSVGEQFVRSGQYEQGYQVLDGIAVRYENDPKAFLELGDAFLRLNAFIRASENFNQAIRLGAETMGRLGLGRLYLARNEPHLAITQFEDVLARSPDHLTALNGLGVAYDLDGQHNIARSHYRRVLANHPGDRNAISNFALSQTLSGQASEASQMLKELSLSYIDNATIRQNLALALMLSGKNEEAERIGRIDLSISTLQANAKNIADYQVIAAMSNLIGNKNKIKSSDNEIRSER